MYPRIHSLELRQPQPLLNRGTADFLLCGGRAYNFRISQDTMLTDWCWPCMSRLNYIWVWKNSEWHLEIQPQVLKWSREICNLYQGPKSLDTRWFKDRFISYSESLNWLLSILEFLCFNKYQLKATNKHIAPPWASVFLSLNKSDHNSTFVKSSELH